MEMAGALTLTRMVFAGPGLQSRPPMAARSFCIPVSGPEGLARPLAAARGDVATPAGGLVFVSGALTQQLDEVAEIVRTAWRNVPVCVVPAAGVITERGEFEAASAMSGMLWSG